MQISQLLTQATKGRKLLNKLKHLKECNMLWFFSNEKNFCQDQAHNRQNHRWIAMCPNDVPRVIKTKFPNMVMVFGVISSDMMLAHIFEMGLRVDTEIYLKVMETVMLPWIKQVARDRPRTVTKDKWPPSSPDLNPMDYFFWGVLKNQTNRCPHTTKVSLITSIKEQCISIDREMVKKACGNFRTRIERVIKAEGNYVK